VTKIIDKFEDYIKAYQDNKNVMLDEELPLYVQEVGSNGFHHLTLKENRGNKLKNTIEKATKKHFKGALECHRPDWIDVLYSALFRMHKKYNKDLQEEYNTASLVPLDFYKRLHTTIKNLIFDKLKPFVERKEIKIKETHLEKNKRYRYRDCIPKRISEKSITNLGVIFSNGAKKQKVLVNEKAKEVKEEHDIGPANVRIFYDDIIRDRLSVGDKIICYYTKLDWDDEDKMDVDYTSLFNPETDKKLLGELLETITKQFPKFAECKKLFTAYFAHEQDYKKMADAFFLDDEYGQSCSDEKRKIATLRKKVSRCTKDLIDDSKKMGMQS